LLLPSYSSYSFPKANKSRWIIVAENPVTVNNSTEINLEVNRSIADRFTAFTLNRERKELQLTTCLIPVLDYKD
jgi:hypothetical protein